MTAFVGCIDEIVTGGDGVYKNVDGNGTSTCRDRRRALSIICKSIRTFESTSP